MSGIPCKKKVICNPPTLSVLKKAEHLVSDAGELRSMLEAIDQTLDTYSDGELEAINKVEEDIREHINMFRNLFCRLCREWQDEIVAAITAE